MKTIKELLNEISNIETIGSLNELILEIAIDSRSARKGTLFAAIRGTQTDGHQYIDSAISLGCKVILCESVPKTQASGITYIISKDSSETLGLIASAFYNHPGRMMEIVGVTGTNGKTTTATLLYQLFISLGYKCGLISTVRNIVNQDIYPSTHTTPDAVRLNKLLAEMVTRGCTHAFMEVSSHAINQNRIKGIHFEGLVFTNITHDHLDYHKTFAEYIRAKKKLFDEVNSDAWSLTNKDDKNGLVMLQNTSAAKYTYSLMQVSDFKAKIIECDFNGLLLNIDGQEVWFKLTGKFNAYNLLAVYGAAILLGENREEVMPKLSSIDSVTGRFEYIISRGGIHSIVDYAHTPDALKNVLETINDIRSHNEKLITIIGCGGNRDRDKRPAMAEIAANLSNQVILTSDNPRTEDPEDIISQMQEGIPAHEYKKVLRITDRKEAIKTAISLAQKGDIILVAGKGHENYQEIKGVKYPFDDKEILTEQFKLLEK